ncbi:MAG: UDP-N-acetylglucosamine 1-carboxyvinyltransferase [Limnochordia bacterium]|jgi:UDP-N-acetylglucosamine 1-carboxyvinyltransferase
MHKLVIHGETSLRGNVTISGAKNAAVALIPACLLTDQKTILENVPQIGDIACMFDILHSMGVGVEWRRRNVLELRPHARINPVVPYELARRLRASSLFLGPLLARYGRAQVAFPGGCEIGSRPIDLHIKGLRELGADIWVEHGYIIGETEGLKGEEIYLDFPSVGATENLMMAATLARGVTTLYNAAKEPEIVDLANLLALMGAKVKGAGTDVIKIEGVEALEGTRHTIIPDRIEAGTYLLAGLINQGEVTVQNVIPKHLEAVLRKIEEAGGCLSIKGEDIHIQGPARIQAVQVKTLPYPGFPTDLQPIFVSTMLRAEGTSIINERVFENRFGHVDELKRLGGLIKSDGRTAVITGTEELTGAPVTASDLRMGAALIVAGLNARGITEIDGVEYIYRGYERIEEKLRGLGAQIYRLHKEQAVENS